MNLSEKVTPLCCCFLIKCGRSRRKFWDDCITVVRLSHSDSVVCSVNCVTDSDFGWRRGAGLNTG